MEEEVSFRNQHGEQLVGFLHKSESEIKHAIVLAHCFTCSKHQRILRKTCDDLAAIGFLVLRFDFSGNGGSDGIFEESTYSKELGDLWCAVDFIATFKPETINLLGHSMGAVVSMLYVANDDRIRSLCVLGAPANPGAIEGLFSKETLQEINNDGRAKVNLFGRNLMMTQEFLDDAKKYDVTKSLEKFRKPLCIIHGDKDTVVTAENAKKLYAMAVEPKELHVIKGADHMFSRDDDLAKVDRIIIEWFKRVCV